jgi:hypothetical protein
LPILKVYDGSTFVEIPGGGGDVVGPGSATDHAIARFHLATGKIIQDSSAVIADNGVMSVPGLGTGGYTAYDLKVGNTVTPDYGMIQIGNAAIGRTSFKAGAMDLDGAVLFRNIGGPVTSKIEFIFAESVGGTTRFAIPMAGAGYATCNPRSLLCIGPAPANTDLVDLLYWQALGWFLNLQCDTDTHGADFGVQNDLEVNGQIWADIIAESTAGGGLQLQPTGGKVGIGIAVPTELLHILSAAATNAAVLIAAPDGYDASLKLFEGAGHGFEFHYDGSADKLHLWSRLFVGNEAIRMTWLKDGKVGIGTQTPATELDVAGTITASTKVLTPKIENAGNVTLDAVNAGAHSSVSVENSDSTYKAGLKVEGNAGVGRYDHGVISSSPLSINWLLGNLQTVTLGINLTISFGTAPLIPTTGMAVLYLKITQGAGTAYTVDIAGVDGWHAQETYVMSTGLGDYDIITIYYDGTVYSATPFGQNFG